MKHPIRNFVFGAGITALLWAPMLKAQDAIETAKIPFDFYVNQVVLPAGQYTVSTLNGASTLVLRNQDTGKSILVMPPGRDIGKSDPQLTFHRCGDHYFLSAIWAPGGNGYILRKSGLEKEMEKGESRPTVAFVPLGRR